MNIGEDNRRILEGIIVEYWGGDNSRILEGILVEYWRG